MVADRLKQQWLYLFLCTRIRDIASLDHLTAMVLQITITNL